MDYQKQLNDLRDNLHRGIVQESTCKISQQMDTTDGVLLLVTPVVLQVEYYHPWKDVNIEEIRVTAVDCNTGDLVGESLDREERNVRYTDLTVEKLMYLLNQIKTKQYQFTEYQCV